MRLLRRAEEVDDVLAYNISVVQVLSVAKMLSIQAHPCKELAEKLHIKDPGVYKDDNHMPKMALAITKFEILCGFVGLEDIKKGMTGNPEAYTELKHRLENLPDNLVVIASYTQGYNRKEKLTAEEKLVLLLEKEYPGDVGGLAAFLMNFVTLNPGKALCLGQMNFMPMYLVIALSVWQLQAMLSGLV